VRRIRIGTGAGFSDDRIEPAVELAKRGQLDYLVFECLAERTIALAQLRRLEEPDGGYDPYLRARMEAVLGLCFRGQRVRIVTNMGAANPIAGAQVVAEVAKREGLRGLKIAAVTGDDVLDRIAGTDLPLLEREGSVRSLGDSVVSANAYLGCEAVARALDWGAEVVITGRISDPSLFLAPLVHEFGWSLTDWNLIGKGIGIGHLLECSGQVTGGYFADPGYKEVPELARLGFPIAEVGEDGSSIITKVPGSGGRVTVRSCIEQILYEVHDPAAYLTADAVADFSGVHFEQVSGDAVAVFGITGRARPESFKVSVGYRDGAIGGGEVSYGGPGAVARARLAVDVVAKRLELAGVAISETRSDLIGIDALHHGAGPGQTGEPGEVRVRIVGRTKTIEDAQRIGHEVFALGVNGPAAGGGLARFAHSVIAVASVLLPRERVATDLILEEV
jgi:hypothetical protein